MSVGATRKEFKICHLTSVHRHDDVRIFHKECSSLAKEGYKVYLVAQGVSCESKGVRIVGIGNIPKNHFLRWLFAGRKIFNAAKKIDADIYHFHDPELLPYGLKLKKAGKKVIFDSHEDVASQIRGKRWIPRLMRRTVSRLYRCYETYVVKELDAVVAATPYIRKQFENRTSRVIAVCNYPMLEEIIYHENPFSERQMMICYAGGISEERGEKVMIEAMKDIDADLVIAGYHDQINIHDGKGITRYVGRLDRNDVNELYGNARMGLCLLQENLNYRNSLPVKMFEYMGAGLPYICSDFPLWKKITEETGAGLCVNAQDIHAIREGIKYILLNPGEGEKMGRQGRKAIEEKYNWDKEKEKLIDLYKSLYSIMET